MKTIQYHWLKFVVWYHMNFCFSDSEVQLLAVRFIRKGTVDVSNLNIIADTKHWVIAIDE